MRTKANLVCKTYLLILELTSYTAFVLITLSALQSDTSNVSEIRRRKCASRELFCDVTILDVSSRLRQITRTSGKIVGLGNETAVIMAEPGAITALPGLDRASPAIACRAKARATLEQLPPLLLSGTAMNCTYNSRVHLDLSLRQLNFLSTRCYPAKRFFRDEAMVINK
ncbi:hypothetical protein J6590_069853 [Homalodisca vitripennis]|nr:hypothetical protein J6590_069853 [Homalodisca vitripennis]